MVELNVIVLTGAAMVASGVSIALFQWTWQSDAVKPVLVTAQNPRLQEGGKSFSLENRIIEHPLGFLVQQGGVPGPPPP